jgi:hypothetical protein
MTIIDNKGKLFGLINIVDLCILLIILLAVGFVGIKAVSGSKERKATTRIEYDVELRRNTKEFSFMINEGDIIRDSINGDYLGKVLKKELKPSIEMTENSVEGKFVESEMPDLYDVIITIEANGRITESEIIAEDREIKIGRLMYVKGKGYAGGGYILAIRYDG